MELREGCLVGKGNFGIDLVELFANMSNGESFERAHHHVPPGQELALLPHSKELWGFSLLPTKLRPPMLPERIEIDVFDPAVKQVIVTAFGDSIGCTHMDPICSFVTSALESIPLNESLQKMNGVLVEVLPVGGDPSGAEGEKPGCEAFYGDPGEDEESSVVGKKVEVFDLGWLIPADELISCPDPPGGRSPSETGKGPLCVIKGDILEVAADDLAVAEVVAPVDKSVVEGLEGSVSNRSKMEGLYIGEISVNRAVVERRAGKATVAQAIASVVAAGGKLYEPSSVKSQKDFPASHILEATVWLEPAPFVAQYPRDLGSAAIPVSRDGGLDFRDIRLCKGPGSYGQSLHDHCIAEQRAGRQPIVHREGFFSAST